jgi:non-ribosomal peptide synthetase component F
VTLGAYEHQDVPFEKLVEELSPERDLSRSPLFQVKLVLQNMPREDVRLDQLNAELVGLVNSQVRFDLTLVINDDSRLKAVVTYASEIFDRLTIERMLGYYRRIMQRAVDNPGTHLSDLTLISDEERRQIVVDWNSTWHPMKPACIHHLFEAQVQRSPEAIAVSDGGRNWTYAELNRYSNQIACSLLEAGIQPEVRVGICLRRGLELVAAILGVLKAGGSYVPLSPSLPQQRLNDIIEDAQIALLLSEEATRNSLPSGYIPELVLDREFWEEGHAPIAETQGSAVPENLAYVIFTSGSTGRPKGVGIEHRSVCNLAARQIDLFQIKPGERILQYASSTFDASVWEWIMALATGAQLVMASGDDLLPGIGLE